MITRAIFIFVWSGANAVLAAGDSALGSELPYGKAAQTRANAQCAAYGPGFAAVEGSEACVWTGGHVRVEVSSHASGAYDSGRASGGAVPAGMRLDDTYERSDVIRAIPARGDASASREHLRPRGAEASGSIYTFGR